MLRHAGDGEWVIPHRVRLEEVRLGLLEAHLAARLELGTPAEVTGDLEALVHAHPEREGFAALLMVALYRDGRQADALATYQRTRSWLLEELGLDPGSDLQQLEQEILAHDPSLGVPQSTVRARAPTRPAGNLPAMSAELIGRDTDLAAIVDLLTDSRLVEVVGPGGVGKTAAAIAAGRSLRGSDLDRRRRVARQARDGHVRRRRGRHRGCRAERRWRGGTPRTAQERPGRADPRQLRARPRLGDGAGCPIARCRARLADPLHEPSPARPRW